MRLSWKTALIGLVSLVVSSGAVAFAREPVNLLSNGGFEQGTADWRPAAGQSLASDPAVAHSGKVIGVIASPDHGGGYGKACVFAPELTREAILDALRARHCYGTTAAKIFLDVRVDGHLMGETVTKEAPKSVKIDITTRCPADIDRIEVCRNNRFIYSKTPTGRQSEFMLVDREPLPGRSYYYVRVIQKDEEIAWSSPVWFGAE